MAKRKKSKKKPLGAVLVVAAVVVVNLFLNGGFSQFLEERKII